MSGGIVLSLRHGQRSIAVKTRRSSDAEATATTVRQIERLAAAAAAV